MGLRYDVTRSIAAPPERVWELLTDAGSYAEWNPSVLGIEGTIAVGEKLSLESIANPGRSFKLKVTEMRAPSHMVWSGGNFVFKGVRTYTLRPQGGGTEFSMVEEYSGMMAGMISKRLPDLTESFETFADGLKAGAEAHG